MQASAKAKNYILLLFGGGGSEHEISRLSSRYLIEQLNSLQDNFQLEVLTVEIKQNSKWLLEHPSGENISCTLNQKNELCFDDKKLKIAFCVPCIHGPPGETGEIQAVLNFHQIPFFGSNYEGHMLCFNKIQTKLLLESRHIPTTPFEYLNSVDLKKAEAFFEVHNGVFIKSSHQGSSIGCHLVKKKEKIEEALIDALSHSPYALLEQPLVARELEVSVYQINNEVKVSRPGEIICDGGFYDFKEKYSNSSQSTTKDIANIDNNLTMKIQRYAIEAFKLFQLRDLARIDFFLVDQEIYLNEINTFPGLTPISMFPKMVEANGDNFSDILKNSLKKYV